jgi:hypothetical protein
MRTTALSFTPIFESDIGTMNETLETLPSHFALTPEDSFPAPKWYFQQMMCRMRLYPKDVLGANVTRPSYTAIRQI